MYYLTKDEQLLAEIQRLLEQYPVESFPAFEAVVDKINQGKDY